MKKHFFAEHLFDDLHQDQPFFRWHPRRSYTDSAFVERMKEIEATNSDDEARTVSGGTTAHNVSYWLPLSLQFVIHVYTYFLNAVVHLSFRIFHCKMTLFSYIMLAGTIWRPDRGPICLHTWFSRWCAKQQSACKHQNCPEAKWAASPQEKSQASSSPACWWQVCCIVKGWIRSTVEFRRR